MRVATSWEKIVLGGTVLTMEPGSSPIRNGAVAVADGRVAAVGPAEELLEMAPTGDVVTATSCLILPGFVNTHSHLAMTLLRGLADDLPLQDWLEHHIWPAEKAHMNRETVRLGTQLAAAEQLLAGITTTTDMYFFGDEVASVLAEVGMRGVVAESLIDFPTPSCATPEEMMAKQRELIEQFRGHSLITPSVAAHAPYTVSAKNLVAEAELAEEHGVPYQIHLSETRWEVEKLLQEKGVSPVTYLADLGVLSDRMIAAHCVHVAPEDIDLLTEFEVGVSHNIASNLKLASGISPVPAMVERGVKLGLGTDGAASNNTLDLLRDMQLTALIHKGTSGDPTALPARKVLEMATVDGARVLGLDNVIGTLSEGREADLICIDTDRAHATPLYDPFSHIVFAARAADVRHVMVRGKVVVRNRRLETLDLEAVQAQACRAADRIQAGDLQS
jgi:5-methylthioadenosine/S-adenosylhomocysteine deaminase